MLPLMFPSSPPSSRFLPLPSVLPLGLFSPLPPVSPSAAFSPTSLWIHAEWVGGWSMGVEEEEEGRKLIVDFPLLRDPFSRAPLNTAS